jgi:hypothetical protein
MGKSMGESKLKLSNVRITTYLKLAKRLCWPGLPLSREAQYLSTFKKKRVTFHAVMFCDASQKESESRRTSRLRCKVVSTAVPALIPPPRTP